jgi:hypothetical protein
MIIEFPSNTQYMRYEYHRVREGPNYFVTYYKHSSRLTYDPKDAWRTLGVAKFTDMGKALKEWCLDMYGTYSIPQREKWGNNNEEGHVDTSFASEAQEAEEPTANTKMIT